MMPFHFYYFYIIHHIIGSLHCIFIKWKWLFLPLNAISFLPLSFLSDLLQDGWNFDRQHASLTMHGDITLSSLTAATAFAFLAITIEEKMALIYILTFHLHTAGNAMLDMPMLMTPASLGPGRAAVPFIRPYNTDYCRFIKYDVIYFFLPLWFHAYIYSSRARWFIYITSHIHDANAVELRLFLSDILRLPFSPATYALGEFLFRLLGAAFATRYHTTPHSRASRRSTYAISGYFDFPHKHSLYRFIIIALYFDMRGKPLSQDIFLRWYAFFSQRQAHFLMILGARLYIILFDNFLYDISALQGRFINYNVLIYT